ncbi:protein DOWN-REGULATED IN DIF1 11-like [Fagus crenata]|jgi:hypothetical protein
MAKFNNIFMVALILASGVLALFAQETEESISPSTLIDDTAFPPEGAMPPETEHTKYLEECARKVQAECGKEIFLGMFESLPVTKKCCLQLVKMGKTCHDDLVNAIIYLPEFSPKASVALSKSVQIWDECVLVSEQISPAPSPSY